jgi:hypothetical protein
MGKEFADPPIGFKNTTTDLGLPSTTEEDDFFLIYICVYVCRQSDR